ncbi:MAG: hypothetical protein GKR89_28470 [Candidatus Latescibacteria bacterium]|nr:hypothetical protein [Candidatus Latescibacterota bacterium]
MPQGPGVLFTALDPAIKKWYRPQELFAEHQWRQWSYTNYARQPYRSYRTPNEAGQYFYDAFGQFLMQGALVFDWSSIRPFVLGSKVVETGAYTGLFRNLVVAGDVGGRYRMSILLGDEIHTVLTPLTFAKAGFNGLQFHLATDGFEGMLLASRPSGFDGDRVSGLGSEPNEGSNVTNLLGGRLLLSVGPSIQLGATYVNAFHVQTRGAAFQGNPFKGSLTQAQNVDVEELRVRLSDDSPEDFRGGMAFFSQELIVTTTDGRRFSNRRPMSNEDGSSNPILPYRPVVEGGLQREGFLTAQGNETIELVYRLDRSELERVAGIGTPDIKRLSVRLLVANDYRIDLTSNAQRNQLNRFVFLSQSSPERTIRAPGNVRDFSNQRLVEIDYGLPTANEIAGVTLDIRDLWGSDVRAEYDRNRRHRRFPRSAAEDPTMPAHFTETADAWFVNMSKRAYPFFLLAEAYSIDPQYSTSAYAAGRQGDAGAFDYDSAARSLYEFVDDNDDLDRLPDWQRIDQAEADRQIFPGWDEDNDLIADFNQNHVDPVRPNFIPDWEEPFLRYNVDRPQFLFGLDMNNNGVVDRFENDAEPDYPYKRDRRGYNFYSGIFLGPYARLIAGRVDERQLADDRRNTTHYLLLAYEQDIAGLGRLRLYQNLRRAQDDIKDNLFVWRIADGVAGEIVPREDQLPARDAWINTLYLQFDYKQFESLNVVNKLKWEVFKQLDYSQRTSVLPTEDIRETAGFLGLINKIDYTGRLGRLVLQPRWKSEFQRFRPSLKADPLAHPTTELRESMALIMRYPILSRTFLQVGTELLWTKQFRQAAAHTFAGSPRSEQAGAIQVVNRTEYLGYEMFTLVGVRMRRLDIEALGPIQQEAAMFLSIYAGLGM